MTSCTRPADYFAMLAELGFLTEDEEKTHGDLPDDIVEAVRDLELNTQHLSASLRGYQSFGARFALVQRKVIIGDEMGLGKTVEALAVLAHLRAKGVAPLPRRLPGSRRDQLDPRGPVEVRPASPPVARTRTRDSLPRNWVRNGGRRGDHLRDAGAGSSARLLDARRPRLRRHR